MSSVGRETRSSSKKIPPFTSTKQIKKLPQTGSGSQNRLNIGARPKNTTNMEVRNRSSSPIPSTSSPRPPPSLFEAQSSSASNNGTLSNQSLLNTTPSAVSQEMMNQPSSDENRILEQLNVDSMDLSPELAKLAHIIVRAMLSITDAKLEAERRRHDAEVESLRNQVLDLVDQKDELENYGRRNTIVISGSAITPATTNEDCYNTVLDIVSSKTGVQITRNDIDVCHRLPPPRNNGPNGGIDPAKKPIIVKFTRRETKHTILRASRVKKPSDIYFNESLSSTRQKILYVVRKTKADHPTIVSSYKTEDNNIRVYSPSPGEPGSFKMSTLNTRRQLDEFLLTKLNFNSTKYIAESRWPNRRRNISAPTSGASRVRI